MDKTIILITDGFPYGVITESVFLKPELEALGKHCSRILLLPATKKSEAPDSDINRYTNTELCDIWLDSRERKKRWLRLRYLFHPSFWRFWTASPDRSSATYILSALAFKNTLRRMLDNEGLDKSNCLIYSFWFDFTASGTAMVAKSRGIPMISRCHGFDIYTKRAPKLRKHTLELIDSLYPVSQAGIDYFKGIFPSLSDKIKLRILGCTKIYPEVVAKAHSREEQRLTFLSVSRVIPDKRVWLNIRLLAALAISRPALSIKLIHIGDGSDMENVKELARTGLPANMGVELRGPLDNEAVHRVYSTETIDWTMRLSSLEGGRAISICESLAYGIPAIGTAVGGISEIIDDEVGLLLSPDPSDEEFVYGIAPFIDSPARYDEMKKNALKRWRDNYDSSKLRNDFAIEITSDHET